VLRRSFIHPGNFALALPALGSQVQAAALSMTGKVGDGDAGSTIPKPNIEQQALAELSECSLHKPCHVAEG
jgi:hypothetical protein